MKLSFGMIFSIILIIVFLSFAFYAIKTFLNMQSTMQVGKFVDELRNDVDKMWKSSQGSQEREYILPKKIDYICFVDYNSNKKGGNIEKYSTLKKVYYENENFFFYPVGSSLGIDACEIKHINLEKITQEQNPFCIENKKGKINIVLKKDFGEALVNIEN